MSRAENVSTSIFSEIRNKNHNSLAKRLEAKSLFKYDLSSYLAGHECMTEENLVAVRLTHLESKVRLLFFSNHL